MARYPELAEWRGPTVNEGDGDGRPGEPEDRLTECRGVVLHIAEGTYAGTIAWQRNPGADVSSHFICAKDGRAAQMVDTADRAWTQRAGNRGWWSIENEGYAGERLTEQQLMFAARVLVAAHRAHGVPVQVATTPSGRGLGHHSMGAESGVDWGHSDCPGEPIKAQKPDVVRRALAILGQPVVDEQLVDDGRLGPKTIARWQAIMGTPVDGVISHPSALVRAVQQRLNAVGATSPALVVDGEGIHQDGRRSRTIGGLQAYLSTPQDGMLSVPVSQAVRALQRRLNGGAF